jgi:putative glutathione S-transferase
MKGSVNMWHIKAHNFTSHPVLDPYAIAPVGPGTESEVPHDRARLSANNLMSFNSV